MKKIAVVLIGGLFLITGAMTAFGGEKASENVKKLAQELEALGSDPVIVSAVKVENAKRKSLEKIKEIDQKWIKTVGVDSFMNAIMSSACSNHLNRIKSKEYYYDEIFVTDNQGANVAMTSKTSDYWQGDEAKFINSYKGGVGAVYISDVTFDESTQAYLAQISVPVMDGDRAIGVITIGINVDEVD